jgi:hypothetical protein
MRRLEDVKLPTHGEPTDRAALERALAWPGQAQRWPA